MEPKESDRKEKAISQAADFQGSNRQSTNFKFPQLDYPSRDNDRSEASSKAARDEASGVGQTSHPHLEAHEVTSPIKRTINDPTPMQKPISPPNMSQLKGKANLKRIACEKGKEAQGEQKASLLGYKRSGKLVFSDELEGALPQKRLCETHLQSTEPTPAISAVAAKQHRRAQ